MLIIKMEWISVKNYDVILPSKSSCILVTDGTNYSVIKVKTFLEIVDKSFCQWTHWMKIPKVN